MAFDKAAFGKRLCASRENQNLSRADLAGKLNISEVYLFQLEAGRKTPSMNLYIDIVNALNVPADSLIRDSIDAPTQAAATEITDKFNGLSGKLLNTANAVLETLIDNLKE